MGSARLAVGGAEIAIAPSDLLKINENPSVFQHFHILGLLGNLWGLQELILSPLEPPDAHLEPFGASRSSFGALWSLQNAIMEHIYTILELLGVSKSLFS